ncbi:hypothetical protein [Actinoplanes sp. NPDC051851]|uniref:phasin family protein n=1 Tax=Actinoplanes sp. NPDC051851 TaxID=3154753 RepID=UPI003425E769
MPDAWRAYLDLALGLTEAPRKRAQKVAGDLLTRGGATAVQVQGLVEDLLSAGGANREALTSIVRYEVDRALGRVGLATAEEVAELTGRVHDLERRLREAQARVSSPEPGTHSAPEAPATASSTVRKAAVKKAVAKKTAATATPNAMPAAAKAQAAPAKRATPVKKAAPLKKATPVKRAPAKRTAPATSTAEAPAPAEKAPAKKAPVRRKPTEVSFVAPPESPAAPAVPRKRATPRPRTSTQSDPVADSTEA